MVTHMFQTLVFHEIRPKVELDLGQRPIKVADNYADSLPLALYDELSHFEQRIHQLVNNGYHFLTLDDVKAFYLNGTTLPEKSILLTFDDCYQSLKEFAYPLLKQYDIPATAFVATGWLFDNPSPYDPAVSRVLAKSELADMSDVFAYANHTSHFHQRKGTTESRPMWETTDAFIADLKEANAIVPITDVFAYPFGLYDQNTVATLNDQGFYLAFTTKTGTNDHSTPRLELNRTIVGQFTPL